MFRRLCTPDKCDSNSTTDYKHAANTVNMTKNIAMIYHKQTENPASLAHDVYTM